MTSREEELKKRAHPALRHAELVELAEHHSPNEAHKLASGQWPRRQAQACRSLAVLRRDFPDAFCAFIRVLTGASSSGLSGTEHAPIGGSAMAEEQQDREKLKQTLSLITDPAQRLRGLFRHGLTREAEEFLRFTVAKADLIYFQHLDRKDSSAAFFSHDSCNEFMVCVGRVKTFDNNIRPALVFDHEGLRRALGWTEAQRDKFMVEVIRRAIACVDPTNMRRDIAGWAGSWEINATAEAMNRFIPKGHELRAAADRWCLRAWFFDQAYISCYFSKEMEIEYLGGEAPSRSGCPAYGSQAIIYEQQRQRKIMELLIERLKQLDMSADAIREDFYLWLDRYVNHLNPELLTEVANAPIFTYNDERRAKIMGMMIRPALEGMMDGSLLYHPMVVARLIEGGMLHLNTSRLNACSLFRKFAAEQLAKGHLGRIMEITAMIGYRFFGELESRGPGEDAPPNFDLAQCAALAFQLAWEKGEYGIAAALVRLFGDEACLDPRLLRKEVARLTKNKDDGDSLEKKLDELIERRKAEIRSAADLAKTTNKPIRLDYSTKFTPRL
jgi:hypothetical protein